jgi:Lon protease-like protein
MSSAEWAALPIFPLPGVQLFPHALLPLHVFEPRYRDLVRDCMAGDRMMAVATLEPGFEKNYDERPSVRLVCGVGRVIAHDLLADGRSNILLRGSARARIVEELPPERAYRLVHAAALDDVYPAGVDLGEPTRTLVTLADQLALRLPSGTAVLRELARSQREAGPLSDVLAAALVTDPDDRQALIEMTDVRRRVETLTAHLGTVLARFVGPRGPAN